jgi:hypothetical protein
MDIQITVLDRNILLFSAGVFVASYKTMEQVDMVVAAYNGQIV